ncbi:hypothetical protein HUN19_18230 [Acinetobacter oleivorans]|nr:hypothetical protein [Acinetobacter oleivorans]
MGTGIAIGMCVYKKKQKNSKSFNTNHDSDSVTSKDRVQNQDDGSIDNAVQV